MSHRHMMMNRDFSLSQSLLKRSLAIGACSTIALLAGWTPSAFAQESPITRYTRSAIELEQMRQGLEQQVQQATGGNVPQGVCQNINQVNSGARDQVRNLCQQFRQSFYQILSKQNPPLSLEEFNSFQSQIGNRSMCERVAQEARRLQIGDISCQGTK